VWPRAVPVEHRGPEGQPLRSWLLLPARAPGSPPPPLVVFPYPGSSYAGDPSPGVFWAHASDPTAVLVGHGYAVLLPSLPNPQQTDGPADGLAARVLAIIDAAAGDPALAGAFDPTRLGVWGYSFGGYAALVLVAETDRFSAAVADAAPTDLFSMEGVFSPSRRVFADEGVGTAWTAGWTEDLQGGMHAPPWREPARYVHNSPSLLADHITTPVLLVQGEQDNIPLQQAEEMFSALYRQNKDAMLVTYWGESHVISSPGNLRDYSRRALAWLDDGLALSAPSSGIATPPGNLAPASANAAPSTPLLRRAATIGHPPSR
jgi:dipeptidyl aminopeptidase/acylaminoacyl peptidase